MITVETVAEGWPDHDWSGLAEQSVRAAVDASPQGDLSSANTLIEVSVRLTSDLEVRTLNRQYRGKDAPTNVLSFPMVQPDLIDALANTDDDEVLLGDIVLALEFCKLEATSKRVSLANHTAHLIVHGTLHLLGHDHMDDAAAEAMEAIECAAMAALGLRDPYETSSIETIPPQMKEGDSSSGLWSSLRGLFGDTPEPSLRAQIADAIDEHEDDPAPDNEGDLSSVEREMVKNLLDFGERTVDDVGVPRADIVAIPDTISFADLVAVLADAPHSRLPVYRDSLDHVVGMIHIKDAFAILARDEPYPATIEALIRQPLYVPQSMRVLDLLGEMKAKRVHLAIVIDEYSGTEGLVTIEDLIEEIVGDIEDETDDAAPPMLVALGGGLWEADARAELEDIANTIDPHLAKIDEDVDTIGGLAFVLAGHVPQPGECMEHDSGWRIEVIEGDTRRATRLRLHPPVTQHAGAVAA